MEVKAPDLRLVMHTSSTVLRLSTTILKTETLHHALPRKKSSKQWWASDGVLLSSLLLSSFAHLLFISMPIVKSFLKLLHVFLWFGLFCDCILGVLGSFCCCCGTSRHNAKLCGGFLGFLQDHSYIYVASFGLLTNDSCLFLLLLVFKYVL